MAKRCDEEEICLHYFSGNAYSWNVIASIRQKQKWHLWNNDWQILATFAKITYRKITHIKAVYGEKTMHLGKVFLGTLIEEQMWINTRQSGYSSALSSSYEGKAWEMAKIVHFDQCHFWKDRNFIKQVEVNCDNRTEDHLLRRLSRMFSATVLALAKMYNSKRTVLRRWLCVTHDIIKVSFYNISQLFASCLRKKKKRRPEHFLAWLSSGSYTK